MASEIVVTVRIRPWWIALFRLSIRLRCGRLAAWLAEHPEFEVSA